MKLSAPIYVLKSQAKTLKKARDISSTEALNEIAEQQGYATWSLLMSKSENLLPERYATVLDFFNEGDLVLVSARPGVGKTVFASGLLAQAEEKARPKGHLFTLVESESDSRKRFEAQDVCWIDCSNDISADYIVARARSRAEPGSLIVVDYLQMLDEKRVNPPLQEQIVKLQDFAKSSGCIIIFLCQLDRHICDRRDRRPAIADIRLPNPLDLGLFNKKIFLHRESPQADEVEVSFAGQASRSFKVGLDKEHARFYDLA